MDVLIQYNYDFHIIKYEKISNDFCITEMQLFEKYLIEKFLFNLDRVHELYDNKLNYYIEFNHNCLKLPRKEVFLNLNEFCFEGCSRFLSKKQNPLNFDLKSYDKNYNEFIKKHPEYNEIATYYYKVNLVFIGQYFQRSLKTIRQKEFDKLKPLIDVFERKIKSLNNNYN